MRITGSGTVLSLLIVAISFIRFLKALTGPAKVFLHICRCTCSHERKKVPQKCPMYANQVLVFLSLHTLTLIWNGTIKACVSKDFHTYTSLFRTHTHTHLHTQTIRSPWKGGWDLRRPNQVWQSTALLKQAPLQPNTAVIVNVRQN